MNNDKRITREGWYNRHLTALPNKECVINIIHKDIDGEHEHLCEWKPFNKSEYTSANMPGEGYLGTATVIKPPFEGIGFHAWEQNNSQFIYYKIIEHPTENNLVKNWWKGLSVIQKQDIAKKHFPNIVKSIGIERTIKEIPSSFLTQIHQIEMAYSIEHPTETETKKEEGKEGDILKGITPGQWYINQNLHVWGDDAKVADCSNNIQSTIYRLKSIQEMEANARLISLAPQLAKENKELKEQIDKIAAELRRAKTFEELAEDTIKEKEKENKSLREANERMKEAFSELMRFKNVMETGADTLQYPDNFLKAIDEAKQALNQ